MVMSGPLGGSKGLCSGTGGGAGQRRALKGRSLMLGWSELEERVDKREIGAEEGGRRREWRRDRSERRKVAGGGTADSLNR